MTREEKAKLYDDLLHESDKYQRMNSKLKSQYAGNIPPEIQAQIDSNNAKIATCVQKLEKLLR